MEEDFNLREFYSKNNRITLPVGVNYGKEVRLGVKNLRLTFLLIYFCVDVGINLTLAVPGLIPEAYRILVGDIVLIIFHETGGIIFYAQLFYRISAASMLMNFCLDGQHQWLKDASEIFDKLKNPRLIEELKKMARHSQMLAFMNAILRFAIITTALTMELPPIIGKYSSEMLYIGVIIMELFIIITPAIDGQFLVDLFMICQVAASTFNDLNLSLKEPNNEMTLEVYLQKFDYCCLFVNTIMSYVRRLFVLFYTVNISVVTFLTYKIFFADNGTVLTILMIVFDITEIVMILFVSQFVGKIDRKAKSSVDHIYINQLIGTNRSKKIAPNQSRLNTRQQLSMWDLRKYFFVCWCTPISLTFLGQSINPETSIKIITVILTAMTVILNH